MLRKRRRPNAIHYNLLLRAVRDCSVGSEEDVQQLLLPTRHSVGWKKIRFSGVMERHKSESVAGDHRSETKTQRSDDSQQLSNITTNRQLTEVNTHMASVPDLLDPQISVDSSVELRLPSSTSDRLSMLGGVAGMLARMDRDRAKPDVKTFSLLLALMPLSVKAETRLLSAMEFYGVQADVDFYNMLIRHRNLRGDFAGAHVC